MPLSQIGCHKNCRPQNYVYEMAMKGPINMKGNLERKQRLFKDINAEQRRFDASIGNNIYCPVCWQQFGPEVVESQLSLEHVPPTSSAKLIRETSMVTLTCNQCNHTYGSRYQNDLKHFLIHQLWQSGKYDGKIPGEITIPGSSALKCNLIWNEKEIKIIGVPKANNAVITEEHISILNKLVETKTSDWNFHLDGNLGYRRANVWNAYLHAAYLMANIRTGYMYSFSNAGAVLRKFIVEKNCSQLETCIIPTGVIGINCIPWIAGVEEPNELRCLWIKVAGNIVVLPQPNNIELTALLKTWQQASKSTDFGLLPKGNIHFKLTFYTREDLFEANKCLSTFFGKSPY